MVWWGKSLLVGLAATVGGLLIAYGIGRVLPRIGWEIPGVLLLSLIVIALLSSAFSSPARPTLPAHFPTFGAHPGVHEMANQAEQGQSRDRKWHPDALLAALPPLLTAMTLTGYLVIFGYL